MSGPLPPCDSPSCMFFGFFIMALVFVAAPAVWGYLCSRIKSKWGLAVLLAPHVILAWMFVFSFQQGENVLYVLDLVVISLSVYVIMNTLRGRNKS